MDEIQTIFNELDLPYQPDNIYVQTIGQILQAASLLQLPRRLQLILAQPKNEVMVHFPVRMDNGNYRLFKGYRVQHNNALGPYKGGIRYHADVSLDHVKSLAVLMTVKCSLAGLPYGGGKGGVKVNPRQLSPDELMRLTRRFTSALGTNIGPDHDIPAPDMGTNAQTMAWMADTFMNLSGPDARQSGLGVVTGKPLEFGGSHGRESATGQGVVYVLEELLPELGLNLANLSFSVIGFGNVGSWTARLLCQKGAKLVAVLEHDGALRAESGLDPEALNRHVQTHHGVRGFPDGDSISTSEFYSTRVDLLIPAALEQMIDVPQVQQLNCQVLVEAANAPVTPAADRLLSAKGISVLPAVLCNAGGVTVSYFEWKQNRVYETWDNELVQFRLRHHLVSAARQVRNTSRKLNCDLRMAAYCTALERIGQVYQTREIFP